MDYAIKTNRKVVQEDLDITRCQESCASLADDGCEACTHADFKFQCICHNISICLTKDLVCNGVPQSSDSSDEDIRKCYEDLLRLGDIKQSARFLCISSKYPDMHTFSTPCDDNPKCKNKLDEK